MGANESVPAELEAQCHLPPKQVKQLVKAFQKKSKKGLPITKDVFQHVVGKLDYSLRASSPLLADRAHLGLLFATLDVNHDGTLDVSEVLLGLSILAVGTMQEKAELVFKAMDLDQNGSLSREEVDKQFQTLLDVFETEFRAAFIRCRRARGEFVPDSNTMANIVINAMKPMRELFAIRGSDSVFKEVDTDGDDKISLAEWMAGVEKCHLVQYLICPELYTNKMIAQYVK